MKPPMAFGFLEISSSKRYADAGESNGLDGLGPKHEGKHTKRYSDAARDRIVPLTDKVPMSLVTNSK